MTNPAGIEALHALLPIPKMPETYCFSIILNSDGEVGTRLALLLLTNENTTRFLRRSHHHGD